MPIFTILDIKRIKYNAINDSYELEADIILEEKEKWPMEIG